MAEYSNLSATINAQIRANGVQAITGPVLNAVLTAMVNVLGDGYRLAGVAHPADNPGSPDNRVAYLAAEDGTYTNFGGLAVSGEVALLLWDSAWTKETLFSIDTAVTPGSGNLVTSGAVDSALTTLANNIAAAYMQLVPAATEGNLAEFDNAGQVRDAGVATADIATKDGAFPDLFAGFAGNLVDTRSAGTPQGPYAFRQSGGDGVDYMVKIKGKTEAFNQLVPANAISTQTVSGVTITNNGDGTYTLNGLASANVTFVLYSVQDSLGHTYLVKGTPKGGAANSTYWMRVGTYGGGFIASDEGDGAIAANASSGLRVEIMVASGYNANNLKFSPCIFDLTLQGLGLTTAAAFQSLHSLPYYNYNAGVLKNNAATGIKTRGFNQWDGEKTEGVAINASTGEEENSAVCSATDYIPIFPNTTYYFRKCGLGSGVLGIAYYDGNKTYISGNVTGESAGVDFTRTTPENAAFMRVSFRTEYVNDICINISDASRNGIYEPYWERTLALKLAEVTGIPEGGTEADRVTIFPNGMGGKGTENDSIYESNGTSKANKVKERVDLGTLTWTGTNGDWRANTNIFPPTSVLGEKILCSKYTPTASTTWIGMGEKEIGANAGGIQVNDSSYPDAASFQAAMNGVIVEYTLSTPVVYTDLQNADGTPFVFPKMIEVDNLGTQERLPADTADNPQGGFESDSNYSVSTANLVRLLNL